MNPLLSQAALVFGILAICFSGPIAALWILQLRKRLVRRRRRAPVERQLLRAPGQSLRDQLDDAVGNAGLDLALLMFLPTLSFSMYAAQNLFKTVPPARWMAWFYAAFALALTAVFIVKLVRSYNLIDKLRSGYDAECAVGQELDQLMRQGAYVYHDLPADNFNIDHVVVSPRGVFAVETKGYTKGRSADARADAQVSYDGEQLRFPTWTTRAPIEQADRQSVWLARWLKSAVGDTMPVIPVLALPGWFVQRGGRGRVLLFSGRELHTLLQAPTGQSISEQDMRRIAHQLEQRCRTVAPRYRNDEPKTR